MTDAARTRLDAILEYIDRASLSEEGQRLFLCIFALRDALPAAEAAAVPAGEDDASNVIAAWASRAEAAEREAAELHAEADRQNTRRCEHKATIDRLNETVGMRDATIAELRAKVVTYRELAGEGATCLTEADALRAERDTTQAKLRAGEALVTAWLAKAQSVRATSADYAWLFTACARDLAAALGVAITDAMERTT